MKRFTLFILLSVLTISWARADLGAYELLHATVDATVHDNNCWDVTETLEVNFTEERHGIYKYIPSRFHYAFTMPDGTVDEKVYKTIVRVNDVVGYDYVSEGDDSEAQNTIIKIGSAYSYVSGLQTYVIKYQIQYLDDRFDGEDFLCHTLWGYGWNTDVQRLDIRVKFDKPLPADAADALNVYSGSRGSTVDADSVNLQYDPATATLSGTVMGLPAQHSVTISTTLPEGFWKAETKNMFLFYFFVLLTLGCAVMYLINIFSHSRRDPIPVVSFHPPAGMSSAEVGKIIDDSTDPEDLASLVPWLAHRGYITIEEIPDKRGRTGVHADLRLTKRIPLLPDAPRYQSLFMNAIFGHKNSVKLSALGDRHTEMNAATSSLDGIYTGKKKLTDYGWGTAWWLFMLIAAVGVYWTAHITDQFDTGLPMIAAFSTLGAAFFIGIIRLITAPKRNIRSNVSKVVEGVICLGLMAAGVAIHMVVFDDATFCLPSIYFVAGSVLLSVLSYLCDRCVYDTEYRLKLMGELLGLRDFIKTAELPKLKMLVDEDPAYFYNVLPYAMVFGLSDKWADLFKDIDMRTPDWYYSSSVGNAYMTSSLLSHTISTHVAHSIKDAVAQASVDPTSSSSSGGFSGGGSSFSGGGGGGGGGGSW